MSFTSVEFLLFFPAAVGIYFLIPHKYRWAWLLAVSYFFYMYSNPNYAVWLAISTVSTYLSGLLIDKAGRMKDPAKSAQWKKIWVALSVVINIGILIAFKYMNFFAQIQADISSLVGVYASPAKFDLLLPAGISFYTFRAISYTVDVYRGDTEPTRHLGKYALFVSFFPQLLAGPIDKSKDLLKQFDEVHVFSYEKAKNGLLLMLWGYFQKMVVADRLAILVNTVYSDPAKYTGLSSLLATVLFAFQLYCDFAGYSNIAVGAAQVMGFRLTVNFNHPYYSKSIKEFWRNWHISLGSWFKDYLYIPLGGNRCSRFRQCMNLVIVFAVCGLWHGAAITFVVWGALHGLYQAVGLLLKPVRQKLVKRLHLRTESALYRFGQVLFTFVLVNFAWIFFRANTLEDAVTVMRNIVQFDPAAFWNGSVFNLGLVAPEFWVGIAGILIVLAVDALKDRVDLRAKLLHSGTAVRWSAYLTTVLIILIFGIYGSQYDAQQFIYSKF